ncbi:MAG: type III polyketide synthase [Oligoflexales bacterium]|nr:type III polyketide synthase [Oligoflexales bacterium]
MPFISSVASCPAPYRYSQDEIALAFRSKWQEIMFNPDRLLSFHQNSGIEYRHLAFPMEYYEELSGFEKRNEAYLEASMKLSEKTVKKVLSQVSLPPESLSLIASATVTGLPIPSLESRLIEKLGLSHSIKRLPIFGLGCLAGVAGINRMYDYLIGHPNEAVLFFTVELCSLTWQVNDSSLANLVASGLFADGCAAVLLVGDEHPLAKKAPMKIRQVKSHFIPNTERAMGFDVLDSGFKVVLSPEVPSIVRESLPKIIGDARAAAGKDFDFFVTHPGGPKLLQAFEEVTQRTGGFNHSWECLKSFGNMSSASVLFILERTLAKERFSPGEIGLMSAFGPAFCAETTIIEAN